ncbi:glycosyltransferase family 8 protein [Lacticaseibacillus sp. GG6-2]
MLELNRPITQQQPINIMLVIDRNMVFQALNLTRTILANNPQDALHFYIICDNVTTQQRRALTQAFANNPRVVIQLITPHIPLPANVATSYRIPKTAYYRIYVDQLLADYPVERILYLDVDMVNTGALRPLYDTALGANLIGAVADGGDLDRFEKMDLAQVSPDRYFNSGMLLIDVARWRRDQIATQVVAYAQENAERCKYHDQDALNAILHSQWQQLHPRYNAQTNIMLGETQRFSRDVLHSTRQNPVLVHFCGHMKPWRDDFPHPGLKRLYYGANLTAN